MQPMCTNSPVLEGEADTREGVQELAMAALLQKVDFSKYTPLSNLRNGFADKCHRAIPAFALHCFPQWKRCSPDTRLRTVSPTPPKPQ